MHKSQTGIALVEVALAIVLLGIVAVTALGQFDDMSDGTVAGVYNSVNAKTSSAAAINYTARIFDPSTVAALETDSDCDRYVPAFPSDFDALETSGAGAEITCR
ncbi:MAG: hypothetical protein PVI79_12870 [Gammaproteobacteria bacterium]|jgi:hypothetical protein